MNPEQALTEAWQDWRRLALAEGEAIGMGNWGLVSACQKALQNLQERISKLSPAVREIWSKSGPRGAAREKALNATIQELVLLERRNQTLLGGIQEATREKLDQLSQTSRNLKQIHNSYGLNRPAVWTSYS